MKVALGIIVGLLIVVAVVYIVSEQEQSEGLLDNGTETTISL